MANRVTTSTYGNIKEVLKYNEFVSTPVSVTDSGVSADSNGRKIVKAGTIVGGKTNSTLSTVGGDVVEDKNTSVKGVKAEGVLLYDVDVTNGPREGAMVISGFINLAKIPKAPDATVTLPKIIFMY